MINLNAQDRSGSSGFMEAAWTPDIVDLARESFGDAMSLSLTFSQIWLGYIFTATADKTHPQTKRSPNFWIDAVIQSSKYISRNGI